MANLSSYSKAVLELLLKGKVDEAESYIEEKIDGRLGALEQQTRELREERKILMTTLQLAKQRGTVEVTPPTVPAGLIPEAAPKRDIILACALDVARKNGGAVRVQEVVDELAARQIDLRTAMPNTSVGVTLHKSEQWRREAPALFRYIGSQLNFEEQR